VKREKTHGAYSKDVFDTFKEIHEKRTSTLHRLENLKTTGELELNSMTLFNYFHYLDEYLESQKQKTIVIRGKRFRRIKYGDEKYLYEKGKLYCDENGIPYNWIKMSLEKPCGDCGVLKGEFHVEGCDIEICPKCGGQLIGFHRCLG